MFVGTRAVRGLFVVILGIGGVVALAASIHAEGREPSRRRQGDTDAAPADAPTRRGKPRVYAPRPETPKTEAPTSGAPSSTPSAGYSKEGASKPPGRSPSADTASLPAVAETPAEADARSEKAKEIGRFLRVVRNKKGAPTSLDTAVVRYVPADGKGDLVVDMVGAVHIGEKQYYKDLNRLFETYDVVLFELVMAEGTKLPDGRGKGDGMMSRMVKSMLELESQVEKVDYTKKNFVHADLSPQQMGEAMQKRGETGLTLTMSVMADMMREANRRELDAKKNPGKGGPSELDLLGAMFGMNSAMKLKRVMAEQMEEAGDANAFGPTLSTLLIDDRNAAAMKVLDREIKNGRKKIAIYYGAAHLPDFDKRLSRAFGLKPDTTTWLKAWNLE